MSTSKTLSTPVAQVAMQRLRRITGTVLPAPCASIAELEGEAIGKYSAAKVVLLKLGERGVPLASREKVEKLFSQRGLEPVWVESVNEIPADSMALVTTGAPVGADVLEKCPKLRLVAVAFTGTDHVDTAACHAKGITVTNVPGYSTESTAELVLGLTISHLHHLPECYKNMQDGRWTMPPQDDLQTKTVGIVGVGKIGLRLAELFKAFKVKAILGYDPPAKAPEFTALGGVYMDSLAGLFLDADVICVCCPLTQNTSGLISDRVLELLRPDSILVNVSRGGVVDETALAKFLGEGKFRAALDVFSTEPLPKDSPLRSVPSEALLMTPHVGYQSTASLEKRLDATVKNILAFLAGQAINSVS